MDKNVEKLLMEEKKVNKQVQDALRNKNELLKTIKKEAEIAMRANKQ